MSSYPTFSSGQVLRGLDLSGMQSDIIVCAAADTVTSVSELRDDTELFTLLEPNASYTIESVILFRSTDATDSAVTTGWAGSVLVLGSIGRYQVFSTTSSAVAADFTSASFAKVNILSDSTNPRSVHQVNSDGFNTAVWCKFDINTPSSHETIMHQWAHSPLGAVDTLTRDAGSYMRVTRFA